MVMVIGDGGLPPTPPTAVPDVSLFKQDPLPPAINPSGLVESLREALETAQAGSAAWG